MNICNDNEHGEIVHEGRRCPACDRINDIKSELDTANERVQGLENRVSELESEAGARE